MKSKRKTNHSNNITRPSDMVRYRTGGATQNHAQAAAATRAMNLLPAGKQYAAKDNGKRDSISHNPSLIGDISAELAEVERWHELAEKELLESMLAMWFTIALGGEVSPHTQGYSSTYGMSPTAEWIWEFMALMREGARHYTVKDWGELGKDHQRWLANAERTIKQVKPTPTLVEAVNKLQDKAIVVTSYKPRPGGLEEALQTLEHCKATCRPGYSQPLMGGMTYHWPGGWGRKVEVKEAKTEPSAPASMPAKKAA